MKDLDIVQNLKKERDFLLSQDYIKRDVQNDLEKAIPLNLIKVITGPRRSGKSTLGFFALKKYQDFFYLNFDNNDVLQLKNHYNFITSNSSKFKNGKVIFLDEIQNIENFELLVTQLQRNGYNIVMTGSNSNLLSKELSTHITGRYVEFAVYPFSFHEAKKFSPNLQYLDYLRIGGFPEQLKNSDVLKDYLSTLFDSIVLKDIVQRYNLRNTYDLNNLFNYLVNNPSQVGSYNSLTKKLGLASVTTVKEYFNYFVQAYLVRKLHYFSYKSSEIVKSSFKTYLIDTGVFLNNPYKFKQNLGYLFEGSIFNLLVSKGYIPNVSLFQFKNSENEVDFYIKRDKNILIQVSLSISENKTRQREFSSLEQNNIQDCQKIVVVLDKDEKELETKEIKVVTPDELSKYI